MPTANKVKLRAKHQRRVDESAIADAVQRVVGSHLLQMARAQTAPVLPAEGLVKLGTVLKVFPVGESTWWAGVRAGKYPAPVHLGLKLRAWKASDIRKLLTAAETGELPDVWPSREVAHSEVAA